MTAIPYKHSRKIRAAASVLTSITNSTSPHRDGNGLLKYWPRNSLVAPTIVLALLVVANPSLAAQDLSGSVLSQQTAEQQEVSETPAGPTSEALATTNEVNVAPQAADSDIQQRLQRILDATEWFPSATVDVDDGVVFLSGQAKTEAHRLWAGQLAGKTQDVVAVVNRIQVEPRSFWDLSPAWDEVRLLARETVQSLPLFLVGIVILSVTWLLASWVQRGARFYLKRRMTSGLLADVLSRTFTVLFFLLGFYFALRVTGMTQVAATLIGGTGLVGLIVGIAFRDIAENFLASILISVQRPFLLSDLIEVEGVQGTVQKVTIHGTLLMTLDGNHVQIPNSSVYKSTIRNLSANPNIRISFGIGVGYDDDIATAQETIAQVLRHHPAVLNDPEPMVLVESLGAATVNLTAYSWIDGIQHSPLRVRSALLRLVKQAVQASGISLPDEAREIVFPDAVPLRILASDGHDETSAPFSSPPVTTMPPRRRPAASPDTLDPDMSSAEGGLRSEAAELQHQADLARTPDDAANLLE